MARKRITEMETEQTELHDEYGGKLVKTPQDRQVVTSNPRRHCAFLSFNFSVFTGRHSVARRRLCGRIRTADVTLTTHNVCDARPAGPPRHPALWFSAVGQPSTVTIHLLVSKRIIRFAACKLVTIIDPDEGESLRKETPGRGCVYAQRRVKETVFPFHRATEALLSNGVAARPLKFFGDE